MNLSITLAERVSHFVRSNNINSMEDLQDPSTLQRILPFYNEHLKNMGISLIDFTKEIIKYANLGNLDDAYIISATAIAMWFLERNPQYRELLNKYILGKCNGRISAFFKLATISKLIGEDLDRIGEYIKLSIKNKEACRYYYAGLLAAGSTGNDLWIYCGACLTIVSIENDFQNIFNRILYSNLISIREMFRDILKNQKRNNIFKIKRLRKSLENLVPYKYIRFRRYRYRRRYHRYISLKSAEILRDLCQAYLAIVMRGGSFQAYKERARAIEDAFSDYKAFLKIESLLGDKYNHLEDIITIALVSSYRSGESVSIREVLTYFNVAGKIYTRLDHNRIIKEAKLLEELGIAKIEYDKYYGDIKYLKIGVKNKEAARYLVNLHAKYFSLSLLDILLLIKEEINKPVRTIPKYSPKPYVFLPKYFKGKEKLQKRIINNMIKKEIIRSRPIVKYYESFKEIFNEIMNLRIDRIYVVVKYGTQYDRRLCKGWHAIDIVSTTKKSGSWYKVYCIRNIQCCPEYEELLSVLAGRNRNYIRRYCRQSLFL